MSFEVIATEPFERKLKRLAKKYRSIATNLEVVIDQLAENPKTGTSLGFDCYKIRVAIPEKGKGKRGGARLITYVRILNNTVFLLDIYDKSERASISNKDLKMLVALLSGD